MSSQLISWYILLHLQILLRHILLVIIWEIMLVRKTCIFKIFWCFWVLNKEKTWVMPFFPLQIFAICSLFILILGGLGLKCIFNLLSLPLLQEQSSQRFIRALFFFFFFFLFREEKSKINIKLFRNCAHVIFFCNISIFFLWKKIGQMVISVVSFSFIPS